MAYVWQQAGACCKCNAEPKLRIVWFWQVQKIITNMETAASYQPLSLPGILSGCGLNGTAGRMCPVCSFYHIKQVI